MKTIHPLLGSWAVFMLLLGNIPMARGQQAEVRYELGKRVQAFEIAWEAKANDPAVKKRVAPVANQAVQNYFRFNFAGVGQTMDEARHLLTSTEAAPAAVRWAESLYVVPETHLLDTTAKELTLTVKPFYKVTVETPTKVILRVQLGTAKPSEHPLGELPATIKVPLPATDKASDEPLIIRFVREERVLAEQRVLLSRVPKLTTRLEALKTANDKRPTPRTTIEDATLAQQVKLLTAMAQQVPQETDYPAARLLAEAEELATATSDTFTRKRHGEYWLNVPTGKSATAVRLLVPETRDEQPRPIVVALHGMGGSENMFFDAYGNGIVPKLAKERGWLIVATRVEGLLGAAPNVPALLDELHKRYAFDRKRVYLIGHSMGAGHAMQLAQQTPDRYAGVAALGGGGRISKPDPLKGVPFYVGCGKLDFALNGARSLAKSLEGGQVTLKEYDDIEHLIIVHEAAPDVFKFFDGLK